MSSDVSEDTAACIRMEEIVINLEERAVLLPSSGLDSPCPEVAPCNVINGQHV
jgi:hypothetical protein